MDTDKKNHIETALLFLVYRRPDTTAKVLEAIREAAPPRLYLACDGPRENIPGETEKVRAVREYVMNNINWNCKIKTLFREKNLGCRKAVSEAITWFFENEEEGIILEDDCLPDHSFFRFCEELLEKYRYDSRIMHISGDNFQDGLRRAEDSYYFSCYNHVWGWASWRRAWKHYDTDMKLWNARDTGFIERQTGTTWKPLLEYWRKKFEEVSSGKVDTWDYVWTFSCWMHDGLSVVPEVNMVKNIGFGQEATHTAGMQKKNTLFPERSEMQFPLKHPPTVERCVKADWYTARRHFGIKSPVEIFTGRLLRIQRKLARILKDSFRKRECAEKAGNGQRKKNH